MEKTLGFLSSLLRLQPESRGEVRENEGKPVALEEPPAWHLFFCWTWYLKVSHCMGLERRSVSTRRSAERDTLLLQRGGQVAVLHGVEDLRRCLFTVTSAALTSSFTFRFTVLPCPAAVCRSERRDRRSATVTALIIKEATSPTTYSRLDFVLAE